MLLRMTNFMLTLPIAAAGMRRYSLFDAGLRHGLLVGHRRGTNTERNTGHAVHGMVLFQVGMLEHHLLAAAGLLGLSQTPWGQLAGGHILSTHAPILPAEEVNHLLSRSTTISSACGAGSPEAVESVLLRVLEGEAVGSVVGHLGDHVLAHVCLTSRPVLLPVYQALPWKISIWSLT